MVSRCLTHTGFPRCSIVTQWYYTTNDGRTNGPVTDAQLAALTQLGRITPATSIWCEGMAKWVPASTVEGIFHSTSNQSSPPTLPQAADRTPLGNSQHTTESSRQFVSSDMMFIGIAAAVVGVVGVALAAGVIGLFTYRSQSVDNSSETAIADLEIGELSSGEVLEKVASTSDPGEPALSVLGLDAKPDEPGSHDAVGQILTSLKGKAAQNLVAQALGNVLIGWDIVEDDAIEISTSLFHFVTPQQALQLDEVGADVDSFVDDDGDRHFYEQVLGGGGTCFLVTPNGHALTNNHVVEEFAEVSNDHKKVEALRSFYEFKRLKPAMWVVLNGRPHRAELIYRSNTHDYAILKIPIANAPYFRLSTDEDPARLTEVMALGFPAAAQIPLSDADRRVIRARYRQAKSIASSPVVEFEYVLTDGKVTSIAERADARWIQHNAAISGGNSGGPLVDTNCIALGINTQGAREAQGTFFALQLNQIKARIKQFVPNSSWDDTTHSTAPSE